LGKLLGIAIKEASQAPMKVIEEATVTLASGVENDFRGHPGKRQATVLSSELWDEACSLLGAKLPWTTRRANLLIEGISLIDTTGYYLHVGDVVLEITGETIPCKHMDQAFQGLKDALTPSWRAGVTCKVIKEGRICVGYQVTINYSF
jgi:MOSC domain-containing protein YiiM